MWCSCAVAAMAVAGCQKVVPSANGIFVYWLSAVQPLSVFQSAEDASSLLTPHITDMEVCDCIEGLKKLCKLILES